MSAALRTLAATFAATPSANVRVVPGVDVLRWPRTPTAEYAVSASSRTPPTPRTPRGPRASFL